jgi:signal transduction histidine kinase
MAFDDFVHRNPGSGPGQAGTAPHPREDPKNFQLPNSKLQRQLMDNTLPATEDVQQNLMSAAWVEEQLLLARRVSIGGLEYFQGCWLDWDAFKKSLLKDVRDLLPSADLEPVLTKSDADEDPHNCLVSLPARLVPGALPERVVAGLTPLESALYLAWACIALTAVAVGVVLHGVLTLSERRGAFVSAVTHELRTPLTTFRMYTEMLAENMIGEDKRRRYMERLRTEADRLGHLVENVLAYARLEQGRHRGRLEPMPVGAILDHARERLAQRAEQAGMTVVFEADGQSGIQVRTDLAATEQVLFNLVDNACKYAAGASDKRIHVEAVAGNGTAGLRVRDHGPGLSRDVQRRLFQPFSKSEIDAANSAPGVGLGLSLCRRLARDLGGDLIHEPQDHGTAFVLHLPREGG